VATVALIRPPSVVARWAATLNATPPLGVAYLAGNLAGHELQVIDAVGEAPASLHAGYRPEILLNGLPVEEVVARVRRDADLIGISSQFSHEWPLVRRLVARLAERFPSAMIVCGGEHVSAMPELSLQQAPALAACVVGEGEATMKELADGRPLREIEGVVHRHGENPRRARLGGVAAPRWDLLPLERYLDGRFSFGVDRGRSIPILATRGCPYRCTFCSSPKMWTTRYSAREPAEVVDEIEQYVRRYRVDNVDFYDLTAIIRREWVLEFCEQMRRKNLGVTWQLPSGTRSEALDGEVLAAMHAAGCRNVSYAPESGSVRTLARILKKVNLERMEASMRAAVAAGLNVKANIVIGFPGEDGDDLMATLRFIRTMARAGVHDVSVWTFSPYPGSQLFDELSAEGRLGEIDDDYFTSLLSYSDLGGAVSYNRNFTSATLQRWRVAGLSLFYLESYARHPARPFRLLRNLIAQRYESRLEMSLANMVRRLTCA
jgi:anaerobic magnesium-protoporphyrin IX monomethyl ester cyclase